MSRLHALAQQRAIAADRRPSVSASALAWSTAPWDTPIQLGAKSTPGRVGLPLVAYTSWLSNG
jgi:hypothetical protein